MSSRTQADIMFHFNNTASVNSAAWAIFLLGITISYAHTGRNYSKRSLTWPLRIVGQRELIHCVEFEVSTFKRKGSRELYTHETSFACHSLKPALLTQYWKAPRPHLWKKKLSIYISLFSSFFFFIFLIHLIYIIFFLIHYFFFLFLFICIIYYFLYY